LKLKAARAILGDDAEAFHTIMDEYFSTLLPYMQRETLPTHEEYVVFAQQFRENRERAAELRPRLRHISAAMVTTGRQLALHGNARRPDLEESIVISVHTLEEELAWTLDHNFTIPDGPDHWPHLSQSGCHEPTFFCLNKAWLSLSIALGTDYVCLWDPDDGWAHDVERLLDFDLLVILDYHKEDIEYTLEILEELHFQGSVYLMPSESIVLSNAYGLSRLDVPGVCTVYLDNYWSLKDGPKADVDLYPLWFKYPLASWQTSRPRDDTWARKEVYVATLTGRPSESERYVDERREAEEFFTELGYSVNPETTKASTADYYGYFGRCKYAFLPMVERNSTGQIIADSLVSSNFTVLPFSYGHKLWMRTLPPFLTIHSMAELRQKIEYLESNEEEFRALLADVQAYAPTFADQHLGETAAEVVAALAVAPPSVYDGVDWANCFRLPSLSAADSGQAASP